MAELGSCELSFPLGHKDHALFAPWLVDSIPANLFYHPFFAAFLTAHRLI